MNEIDTIKYTLEELSQANSKLDEHVRIFADYAGQPAV